MLLYVCTWLTRQICCHTKRLREANPICSGFLHLTQPRPPHCQLAGVWRQAKVLLQQTDITGMSVRPTYVTSGGKETEQGPKKQVPRMCVFWELLHPHTPVQLPTILGGWFVCLVVTKHRYSFPWADGWALMGCQKTRRWPGATEVHGSLQVSITNSLYCKCCSLRYFCIGFGLDHASEILAILET